MIALDGSGEHGWATVGGLCRWAETMGAKMPIACRPTPDPNQNLFLLGSQHTSQAQRSETKPSFRFRAALSQSAQKKGLRDRVLAVIAAGAAMATASAAMAARVTYNFSGNFDAPATGSVSGSVTFDKTTGITSAITMHVTQGKALGGVTDLPANTYILALPVSANWIAATTHPVMVGNRGALLRFQTPGSELGSANPMPSGLVEGNCNRATCTSLDVSTTTGRYVTNMTFIPAPTPTPIPTMTDWARVLFGLILGVAAALMIQRRLFAA